MATTDTTPPRYYCAACGVEGGRGRAMTIDAALIARAKAAGVTLAEPTARHLHYECADKTRKLAVIYENRGRHR